MRNLFFAWELKTAAMRAERLARSAARGGLRVFERKREELVGNPFLRHTIK
jgi:hypothetical protein